MKQFQLTGTVRECNGKKAAKIVRKNGLIPAVLYGGDSNVVFEIANDDVRGLIYTPEIFSVELTIDGKNYHAIVQDVQFHPVEEKILHMDFLQILDGKPIQIEVPVKLEGLAEGVKEGGKLSLEIRKLKVKALYTDVPENLTINVSNLGLGKTIQVGELSFDKLELMNAKNAVVCAVKLTRAARGAKAAAAGK